MKASLSAVPRVKFANLPTPVERMTRLAPKIGLRELWVKRDDLSGLALGGNKTRKLEYLVAEALSHGARTLLTTGAPQSNHCRQTAAAAAKFGFDCVLVLAGEPPTRYSGNLLLDHLFGAEIVWCPKDQREATLQEVFQKLWREGRRPYRIPYGGSNALGVLAYAQAVGEVVEQGVCPEWIVFPSSSGGTQAGLLLGCKLYKLDARIVGISVDLPASELRERIFQLCCQASDTYSFSVSVRIEEIVVDDSYRGEGYGIPTQADIQAIQDFARYEGILLDPVYTGRAAAGLIDLVKRGTIPADASVLFWHTGGTPALFAEAYEKLFSPP
ncbi:MAG: D-cysteine desulfhydrase family protein [Anaerolineales bacterium]|nr:D-cysteine desulfhydrase family protein [Anaerolineales bacterium]MDW8160566.1 D-cysteine desulfhydrase family protein [Anaerolineales bacterium]